MKIMEIVKEGLTVRIDKVNDLYQVTINGVIGFKDIKDAIDAFNISTGLTIEDK